MWILGCGIKVDLLFICLKQMAAVIALFCRLLNNLHRENIVEIQGCYFSTCALMLSYQCFDIRPFGIEKKVNNLL